MDGKTTYIMSEELALRFMVLHPLKQEGCLSTSFLPDDHERTVLRGSVPLKPPLHFKDCIMETIGRPEVIGKDVYFWLPPFEMSSHTLVMETDKK